MNKESSYNLPRYHRIKKLAVFGGFLDGAVFELDKNLNCLIGSRGSGKSTMLELIRYGFDLGPSEAHEPQFRKKFDSLIEKNLGNGRVEIEVETKDGLTYTICRPAGESAQIWDESGIPTNLDLRSGALFRPDIFSQNDVETIADHPSFQLELIDSFCRETVEQISAQLRSEQLATEKSAAEIRTVSEQIETLGEEVKTLPAVLEKLKAYAQVQGPKAEEVNRAHAVKSARDKELVVVAEASKVIKTNGSAFIQQLEAFKLEAESVYPNGITEGPSAALMRQHKEIFDRAIAKFGQETQEAIHGLSAAYKQLEALKDELAKEHAVKDVEFRKQLEKINASNTQLKERLAWEKKKNELEIKQRELLAHKNKLEILRNIRSTHLDRLSELREQRSQARNKVARMITNKLKGSIRVSIMQNGDRRTYRDFLCRTLAGLGIRQNVVADKIIGAFAPDKLVDLIKAKDIDTLSCRSGINPEQAMKVIQMLSMQNFLLELETISLDDLPCIELKDGQQYKEASDLSTGQKCTTILPILMLESDNPLLIDQPEDNLDNRFIHSNIVSSIENVKNSRQMLFVTHNPNIPVLGDAERVFVLHSTGKLGSIAKSGTVDECKGQIIDLLEGGTDAFKKRKERYGY